ncbi:MAG TPA: DMT family transporter [Syntrophales bacterium]|nr:DMT family transporter [Syntrophales bacterium]
MIYAKLFLTALFWGGTFVAARVVTQELEPFSAALWRFVIASAVLTAVVVLHEGGLPRLRRRQVVPVVLLGLTGVFAYNVLFFLGLKTITAGRAALIVANNPVFIALFSALLFRERLSIVNGIGIGVCLAGAVIVISRGDPGGLLSGGIGRGELFILGCVASWVSYSLIGKVVLRDLSPLAAVTWSCLIGAAALLPFAWQEGLVRQTGLASPAAWAGLLFLGVLGTAVGFLWYYEGIRAIGPARAAVFINFVPVSGVLFGWLILSETLTRTLLAGAVLVVAGVFLTNRPNGRKSLET